MQFAVPSCGPLSPHYLGLSRGTRRQWHLGPSLRGRLGKVSPNERRRYICNVFSHWLRLFMAWYKTTRTTRTPAFWGYPLPPHDYPYYWFILDPKSKEDKVKVMNLKNLPKFQIFQFCNELYTQHTFWSCLIRCANMKRIRWVLCGHNSLSTDGQTDAQTDKVKPVYPPFNFVEVQ